MSRGRRISDSVIKLIIHEALANPDMPRRALAVRLQDTIKRMGEPVPTEETLTKMISRFRANSQDEFDSPWTLASSTKYNLPIESTPALLKAWRYCQAFGKYFSIRQAKWAAYLSTVISNTADLVQWSENYTNFEKGYKLRGLEFSSCDLDAVLTMSIYENATAFLLGKVVPVRLLGGGILVRPKSIKDSIEDASAAARIAEYDALNILRSGYSDRAKAVRESDDDWDALPPIKELNLTEAQIWIYVHWLNALTNGPKWRMMERSQVLDNIMQLRYWVSENLPKIQARTSKSVVKLIKNKDNVSFRDLFPTDLIPQKLIEQSGFTEHSFVFSSAQWRATIERMANLGIGTEKLETSKKEKASNKEVSK